VQSVFFDHEYIVHFKCALYSQTVK
jgi:hypothetical protein